MGNASSTRKAGLGYRDCDAYGLKTHRARLGQWCICRRRAVIALLLGAVASLAHGDTQPPAIDLRTHDFADRPTSSLSGRWSIYWNRLLGPAEFVQAYTPARYGDFVMPATWNDWMFRGQPVGRFGHATFAVRIRLPPEMAEVGLRVPNASTAYRLWDNGQLIALSGSPGRNRAATTPRYRVVSPRVAVPACELLLVLHVANYHHRRDSTWKPIELGAVAAVSSKHTLETVHDLLLIVSFAAPRGFPFFPRCCSPCSRFASR